MASGQDDSIVTVVTCQGNISDPDFPYKLSCLVARLRRLLTSDKPFQITNVEPWNSVRVTFNIPREAAQRLRQLAQAGDRVLRDLGILSVQIEGDQVISLTIAGNFNEPQEILLQTTEDERTRPSSSSSSFDVPGLDVVPTSSNVDPARKNIAQYLGTQSSAGSAALVAVAAAAASSSASQEPLFHGPRSPQADFKSPNVVAPGSEPIPFPPKTNPAPSSRTPNAFGPFPFASMTHAMNTMHGSHHSASGSAAATTPPGSSPGRFPFSPPPPYPSNGGGGGPTGAFQPVRHSSSFSPHHSANSTTATTASLLSPTASAAVGSSTVNNLPRGAADRANAALTSPLLVNLLQSDLSSTASQSQHATGKVFPPPSSEPAVVPKRRRKPRKSKEKTPSGSTANSPSASPLASPSSCLSSSSLGTPASDSISHSLFPQPFNIALPTVPSIPLSPSLTPPSASPPSLVGQPFTSMEVLPHSRPAMSTSFASQPVHRVPPLPSPPPTAPSSSASTSNNSGQSSQEAEHELSPWPSPSKRTQHLINPFTGQLEPMSSEEEEEDSANGSPHGGRVPSVAQGGSSASSSLQSNPFSEIGRNADATPTIRRTGTEVTATTAAEPRNRDVVSGGKEASSPSLTPSSPSSVSSTSVVPPPLGGSPSEKIKLRLKLEPKLRIEKDKESGRLGEKQKSEGGMPPLLQYKVDVSFVNIPSRRPGNGGCSSVPTLLQTGVAGAPPAAGMSSSGSVPNFSGNGNGGAGNSVMPLEPRVPPLHISLRGRNAAVVTNPRREDRDKGGRSQVKDFCEPPSVEQPIVKGQRSRSPRGSRTESTKGNPTPTSEGARTAPSAGRRSSISRAGSHVRRGRATLAVSMVAANSTSPVLVSAAGQRQPMTAVLHSSPPLENKSPSPPLQSSVCREKTLLSGGSLVVEPGSPMTPSANSVVGSVPIPRLETDCRTTEDAERPAPVAGALRPNASANGAAESGGPVQPRTRVDHEAVLQPTRKASLELDRSLDPSSIENSQKQVTMQQPPHLFSTVPSGSNRLALASGSAPRAAQGRSGSSELNALLDIPITPMKVPLTRRSSRDTAKNEDLLASVVVRGVKVGSLSIPEATGRSSGAPVVASTTPMPCAKPSPPSVHGSVLRRPAVSDERLPPRPETLLAKSGSVAQQDAGTPRSEPAPVRRRSLGSAGVSELALRTRSHSAGIVQPSSREVNVPERNQLALRLTTTEAPSLVISATTAVVAATAAHSSLAPPSSAEVCRTTCHVDRAVVGESRPEEDESTAVTNESNSGDWIVDVRATSNPVKLRASGVQLLGRPSPISTVDGENARGKLPPKSELSSSHAVCNPRTVEVIPDGPPVAGAVLNEAAPRLNSVERCGGDDVVVLHGKVEAVVENPLELPEDGPIADRGHDVVVVKEVAEAFVRNPIQRVPLSPLSQVSVDSKVSPDAEETDVPSIDAASAPSGIPRLPRNSKLSALALSTGITSANVSRLIPLRCGSVLVDGMVRVVPVDSLPEEEVDGEGEFVATETMAQHQRHPHHHRMANSSIRSGSVGIVALTSSSPCSASPSGSSPDSLNIGTGSEDNGEQGIHRIQRDQAARQPLLPRNHCNSSGSPYEDSGIDSMDAIMEKLSGEDSPSGKSEESSAANSQPVPAPPKDDGTAERVGDPESPGTTDPKEVPDVRPKITSSDNQNAKDEGSQLDDVHQQEVSCVPSPRPLAEAVTSSDDGNNFGVEAETLPVSDETANEPTQKSESSVREAKAVSSAEEEEEGGGGDESQSDGHPVESSTAETVQSVDGKGEGGNSSLQSSSPVRESAERPADSSETAMKVADASLARLPQNQSSPRPEAPLTESQFAAPTVFLELCTSVSIAAKSGGDDVAVDQEDAALLTNKPAVVQVHDQECSLAEGLLQSVVFHATEGDDVGQVSVVTDEETDRLGESLACSSPSETTQLLLFTVQDVDSIVMAGNCSDEMSLLQVTSTNADGGHSDETDGDALQFSTLTGQEEESAEDPAEPTVLRASLLSNDQRPTDNSGEAGKGVPIIEVQLSPLVPDDRQADSSDATVDEREEEQRYGAEQEAAEDGLAGGPVMDAESPDASSGSPCVLKLKVDGDKAEVASSEVLVGHLSSIPNHVSQVERDSLTTFRSLCNSSTTLTTYCGGAMPPAEASLCDLVSPRSRQVTLPIKFVTLPPGVRSPVLAPCGMVAENGGVALAHSISSSSGLPSPSPVKVVISRVGPSSTAPTITLTTVVVKSPIGASVVSSHPEKLSGSVTSTVTIGSCPRVSAVVSPSLVRTSAVQVPAIIPIATFSPTAAAPDTPLLRPVELVGSGVTPSKVVAAAVKSVPAQVPTDAADASSSCPPLYSISQPSTSLDSTVSDSHPEAVCSPSCQVRTSPSPDCDHSAKASVSTASPLPSNATPHDGRTGTPTPSSPPNASGGFDLFGLPSVCINEGKQDSMGSEADTDSSTSSMSSLLSQRRRSDPGREDGSLSKDEADDLYTVNLSITSGDHNYIFRASRMTTREKERDRLQRAERSTRASDVVVDNAEVTTNCSPRLEPLTIEIPSEGETGETERRLTRNTRSNSRLASPTSCRHSAASQPTSPSVNSCTVSPILPATSDTEAEIRTLPSRSATKRRRDDSEDSDTERRKTTLADKDEVIALPVASLATVKSVDRDGSVCPKSPVGSGLNAHVYSKPVKRKCSENAVELIKACIGVDDNPKRVSAGKQQPVGTEISRVGGGKNAKTKDDGSKPKGRPISSAGDGSEESSDDEVTLSELVTKARSSKLKQMDDRSVTRNSKQKQNTKEEEGVCVTKADRVNSRANSRREEGRAGRGAGTPKESRKEERTSTRVGGRLAERGKRAQSPVRAQERSPQRANHRSRTKDQERATSPHNPKEETEAGKRKLRSSGASGYYDSLPQKRRRLSRDNR